MFVSKEANILYLPVERYPPMLMLLSKLLLAATGWTVSGTPPPEKKYMIVAGPHTSNWDFVYGIAAKTVLKLNIRYLGKAELFRWPWGWLFRALGGYPVNRSQSQNMVDAVVEIFNRHETFSIALSPEGTRSFIPQLKTGFYHIARGADIPVYMAGIDYGKKQIFLSEPFFPGPDEQTEIRRVINFFKTCTAKYPQKTF